MSLAFGTAAADNPSHPDNNTEEERMLDSVLSGTPYINSLLVDHKIPIVGGRWGWEMFVDAPLNSEPEGAAVTLSRAKLKYARSLSKNWKGQLSANYSKGGGLELSDSYFAYNGWNRALLTLGITDPPFSLESVSNSSALTFMEPALPVAALSERKSGGVGFSRRNPGHMLNGYLILFNVSEDRIREKGQGVVLHYAHSPIEIGSLESVHLGGSLSYRFNSGSDGPQFRTRPEVATMNNYFVDTGTIDNAERVVRLGLEASQVRGRFSWQSEVLSARVKRDSAQTAVFWGAYAFVSWFLTDDSRNYDFGSGSFEDVQVRSPFRHGGKGAFELAFRASYVDLTDRDVIGGRQKNLSLGLNWYLNQKFRLMANLIKVVEVDRPGSEYDDEEPLIFSMRVQWLLE